MTLIEKIFDRKNHLTSIWGNFDSYYNSKEGIFQDEDLIAIASGQEDFNEIIESFYADIPDRIAKYKDNLHPHFNIVADKINVLHVNSTLLYSVEHQNELAIGTYHLLDALMNIDKSNRQFCCHIILLISLTEMNRRRY